MFCEGAARCEPGGPGRHAGLRSEHQAQGAQAVRLIRTQGHGRAHEESHQNCVRQR
jgi:hypothetical protein